MLKQYCTKTSSLTRVKASFVLSGKVSEILPRLEHVSIFPESYLPNYLDEPGFIVADLNFLILVKNALDYRLWRKQNHQFAK